MRIVGEPGHWREGSDTNHLTLAGCAECDVHRIIALPMSCVEELYWTGHIGQDLFEAYMHAWVTSSDHVSSRYDSWKWEPTIPEVIELVDLIRRLHRERMSRGT